jgi:hypothetical protein
MGNPESSSSIFRKSGVRFSVRKCGNAKMIERLHALWIEGPLHTLRRGIFRSGPAIATVGRSEGASGTLQYA